jgi:hypothetical protein
MKKIYILSLLILATVNVGFAQTPQNNLISWDMESWFTSLGASNPTGWVSANIIVSGTVVISPGINGTDTCAKITTKYSPGLSTQTGGVVPDTSGFMFTGTAIFAFPISIKQGFPYSDRPEYIQFYSKYTPVANDTAFVSVFLFKRNAGASQRDTIATAYYKEFETSSAFSFHTLNLNYKTPLIPANPATDSLLIIVGSSQRTNAKIGSTFYIDGVDDNWTGISKKFNNSSDFISPNPATTHFTWNNLSKGVSRVELYDISGKLVFTENIQKDIVSISTAQLNNGVYFAKAYTLNSELVSLKKVIVSK